MKKEFFGVFMILAFLFISCAKKGTYKCECGQNGSSTVTYTTEISNATKSNASDLCYKAAGANSGMPANSYVCTVSAE
jgi:hypothetical protein